MILFQTQQQDNQKNWDDYVDTEFNDQFMKCCKQKFPNKFKICIHGVTYQMIEQNILIYENLQYDGVKFIVIRNTDNSKLYTPKKQDKPDWLINHVFNNGHPYCYTDIVSNKKYSPYEIDFVWDKNRKSSLTLTGKIVQTNCLGFQNKLD